MFSRSSRLALVAALILPCAASAVEIDPHFSLDPASDSLEAIPHPALTPDDVMVAGPSVYTHGRDLGLYDDFAGGEYDVLDALSYGRDPIVWPLYFSVDRVAVGLDVPPNAVYTEAAPGKEEASGDVFYSFGPRLSGKNFQFIDEEELGLVPGFFGDDLDALDLDQRPEPRTFFSIDQLSKSNSYGTGCVTSDILWSDGDGKWDTYFPLEALGFDCTDDLDALVLRNLDLSEIPNDGDFALFSISTFSPSTYTYTGLPYIPGVIGHMSPADVLWTDFDTWGLWAAAGELGLRPDDELNALDTVPEPLSTALFGAGLLGLWGARRRMRM